MSSLPFMRNPGINLVHREEIGELAT